MKTMAKLGTTYVRDFAIVFYMGDELVGRMTWRESPRLYIDFLAAFDPRALAPMFAAFRKKYPDTFVYFDTAEDNERMKRFIKLVDAQQDETGCYFTRTS